MRLEPKDNCPLDKFKPCRQLDCAWFVKIVGKNPQTNADIDEHGCAIAWLPILTVENSQQQRQTGAAVESFRNEMVKANEASLDILLATSQQNKLLGGQ